MVQTVGPNLMPGPDTLDMGEGISTTLPIGCHTFKFESTDDAGIMDSCVFDVCVDEFANPRTDLVCNPQGLQVSLDENCMATIGADDVLEGGPYGCYDSRYTVIIDFNGNGIFEPFEGNTLGPDDIGNTYLVQVRDDSTGNSCWSSLSVEDKQIPPLECNDLTLSCDTDLTPGLPIGGTNSQTINPGDMWGGAVALNYTFPVTDSANWGDGIRC